MESLWPGEFKEIEIEPPVEILKKQASFLPTLTGDKVFGKIEIVLINNPDETPHYLNDFVFNFYIIPKFLKNYSFKIFKFSYKIELYPVIITIDESIADELGYEKEIRSDNEEEFIKTLKAIFNSKRLKEIIGSIMKLSPLEQSNK